MMNNGILDDVTEMAIAHTFVIKSDMTKAVFIPYFHAVIAAGALRHDI